MTYRKSMSDAIREVQESTIKPYVSMSMGGQYNVLDKDSKVVYSTRDKTLAYDYFKKNFDKLKEEVQELDEGANHQQDLMRRADKYNILMKPEGPNVGLSYLGFKNNKGGTTKTVTKGLYYNSLKSIDQLKKDIDAHMKELQKDPRVKGTFRKEEVEQVTENSLILKAKEIAKKFADSMSKAVAEIEKLEKGLSKNPAVDAELRKYNEDVSLQENESPQQIAKRAQELGVSATVSSKGISISSFKTQAGMEKFMKYIASQGKNMFSIYQDAQGKNLFKQVSYTRKEEIEEDVSLQEVSDNLKLAVLKRKIKQYKDKVFKKTMSTIKSPLFAGYEEVEEGRMKDIFTAGEQGKSAEEIAKLMKLPLKTVKNILGEEVFEEQILEFTSDMITRLQKSYSTMPKKITPEQATALSKHLDRLDLASLKQLTKAEIPFVTALARNKVYKKTGKFEEVEEPKKDMPDDKEQVAKENSDKEIASLKDQIAMLKTKLENEKNKAVKPEPNPKTGEVPLTVGIAHKHFKDQKEKEEKKEVKENVSIKAYKNAVDPTKKGLMISKSGGMSGTIMIKDKKELKQLEDKIAQAKKLYNIKEARVLVDLSVAYKNTNNVDEVQVVVDIPSHKINDEMYIEDEAIDRAEELLKQRKIGPRNVTRIDTMSTELLDVMKTSKPLSYYKATQLNQKEMKETAERDKRIQRAKDMIKFYDKQKKAALKGNNKDLAKKMLKNDSEDEPRQKKITPPLDTTGVVEMAKDSSAHAIGMSQAMKSTGDKPPLDKSTIKKGHKIAKAILNKEEKRMYIESMAGLKKKSEKSGMSYSILKKVYDRGMAAWTSGHRPGASQQQWAYARVNSFITKSSGTWGGADKDLAKQVKG